MALSSFSGTLTQPNATTGNQAITGVGYTPKVVLFWSSAVTATTTLTANAAFAFGMAVSAADQRCLSAVMQDNQASPEGGRRGTDAACMVAIDPTSGTQAVLASAALVSMDADGFTVNWTVCDAVQRRWHFLCLGGADLVGVKGGTHAAPAATGTASVTGVGFRPDALLLLSGNLTTSPGNGVNAGFSLGMATATSQATVATSSLRHATPTNTARYQRTDRAIAAIGFPSSVATVNLQASLLSMDADGFSFSYDLTNTGAITYYLALSGPQFHIDQLTAPLVTGNQAVTGVGFTPRAVLLAGNGTTTSTSLATTNRLTVGAATSNASQRSASRGDQGNANPSKAKSYSDAANVYAAMPETGSLSHVANLATLDADGFTLTWSTVDAFSHQVPFLAFGDTQTVISPTGLHIAGAASGLVGDTSAPLLVTLQPSNAGISGSNQVIVTVSIDGMSGVAFTPGAQLVLNRTTLGALFDFVIPTISGTQPQVVTLRAQAAGLADATLSFTIYPAATTLLLTGPGAGAAGEQSDVYTVALPDGVSVDGVIPATPFIVEGVGYTVPGVVLISQGTRSGTFRVVVPDARTVHVGVQNTAPLTAPATIAYTTTITADYTITAPFTVAAGEKTGTIRIALRSGLVLTRDLHVTLSDDRQQNQRGTYVLDLTETVVTSVTLTQTTRSVAVQYQAATGVGVTDSTGAGGLVTVHLSLLADDDTLVAPAAVPLDVFDPAVYNSDPIGAIFQGFSGLAAQVTFTLVDELPTFLYDHPSGRVREGAPGSYFSDVVKRLDMFAQATWVPPAGYSGGPMQVELPRRKPVGPSLSTTDLVSIGATPIQSLGAHAADGLLWPTVDVTDLEVTDPSLTNALRRQYYLRVNATLSSAGVYTVRNSTGVVIGTLTVTTTSDQTTVAPA